MSKDYYKILGVDKSASADEIKKAFRKLAHEHHPDKKGGDEQKFKEVNEAYQVIGNAEKRKQYDQFGATFDQQGGFGGGANWDDFMRAARGGGGFQGAQGFDFGADLGDMFGDFFGFGGGRSRSGGGQQRGHDIEVDVELSFEEAAFGVEKTIQLMKNTACAVCSGSGTEPGSSLETCSTCNGQGQVRRMQQTILGAMQTVAACPTCNGKGQVPKKKCAHCSGRGVERKEVSHSVKIPGGIRNGEAIRLSEKGENPGQGGVPGDLYMRVHVRDHQKFQREGFDIFSEEHITFVQAVIGDKIEIDTLDGKKKLVIPPGTQSHQQFRLRGLGTEQLGGGGRADQYVRVIVDVPKKISRSAKKLIEQLGKEL